VRVLAIVDGRASATERALTALVTEGASVLVHVVDEPAAKAALLRAPSSTDVTLAIGPRSARAVAAASERPRAALLVRRADAPVGLATVALDVDIAPQARWIGAAFPGRSRLLVVRRPGGTVLDVEIRAAATAARLDVQFVDADDARAAPAALERALRRDRARVTVWVIPDPDVITATSVPALVEIALRARVPLIGFSPFFLDTGALGAIRTTPEASARAALFAARAGTAPGVLEPPDAHLAVSGRLAEKLGIVVAAAPGVEVLP
jgi:ABC-type uncharacterized transport system substrate-binding protein